MNFMSKTCDYIFHFLLARLYYSAILFVTQLLDSNTTTLKKYLFYNNYKSIEKVLINSFIHIVIYS